MNIGKDLKEKFHAKIEDKTWSMVERERTHIEPKLRHFIWCKIVHGVPYQALLSIVRLSLYKWN